MKRVKVTEAIELGLCILAQDLIGTKKHTEKDIQNYINQFVFVEDQNTTNKVGGEK